MLGAGFEQLTLDLGQDDEGELVATLVRSLPDQMTWWHKLTGTSRVFGNIDVLYVHGWSDYFFQKELAHFWTERGAQFYALDLRKYGRSLREGQAAGYINDLAEYDLDIEHALNAMPDRTTGRRLVLLGHSTGGLILSLWVNRNPGVASALILNSPWLEFQLSGVVRKLLSPLVDAGARFRPHEATAQIDYGYYSKAQQMIEGGTDVAHANEEWRPPLSMPVRRGWISAILEGHDQVEQGLDIDIPVCVMLSRRSVLPTRWSEELIRADSVINVTEVARAALHLGDTVTIGRIDGALHDIFISATRPRQEAFTRMERWTRGFLAGEKG